MAYQVVLEVFEGPLDLLLHLIQKNEVDIYNIPVAGITAQYLEYLQTMQELDLELASEFLVMAATLLALKAKMLLPQHGQEETAEAAEPLEEFDPRQDLVEKLLEYKAFKEAASELHRLEEGRSQLYTRPLDGEALRRSFPPENPAEGVSLWDLLAAFQKSVRRLERTRKVVGLPRREFTLEQKLDHIRARLASRPAGLSFRRLLESGSKAEAVITFLAVLELARLAVITIGQKKLFGEIMIRPKPETSERGKEGLGPVLGA